MTSLQAATLGPSGGVAAGLVDSGRVLVWRCRAPQPNVLASSSSV